MGELTKALEEPTAQCLVNLLNTTLSQSSQEGAYLLVGELTKALEEPGRRRGAADAIALFCRTAKFDFQEHLPALLTVRIPVPSRRQSCQVARPPAHQVAQCRIHLAFRHPLPQRWMRQDDTV